MTRPALHQTLRFAVVGGAVAVFYVLLYTALKPVLSQAAANALAFLLAVALQYVAQTVYTFRRPLAVPTQIGRFTAMVGCGLIVSAVITGWVGPTLGWPDWAAATTVTVVLPVQNYLFMKFWVYSIKEAAA